MFQARPALCRFVQSECGPSRTRSPHLRVSREKADAPEEQTAPKRPHFSTALMSAAWAALIQAQEQECLPYTVWFTIFPQTNWREERSKS